MTDTRHILPSEASPTGKYRGICTWAERPLTHNSYGDTLRISDQSLLLYVWTGSAWSSPDPGFLPATPGPVGDDTPDTGAFTDLTADTAVIGEIDGIVGANTPAAGTFTDVVAETAVLDAIDGPIGVNTPAAGSFTDVDTETLATGSVTVGATAPVAADSTGTAGEIRLSAGFIYICTATDTWKRVAIATWP